MFHDKPKWFKLIIVCTVCLLIVAISTFLTQHFTFQ